MSHSTKPIKSKYASANPGHVEEAEYFYYDTAPSYNEELAIVCGGYEKCAPDFDINRNHYPYYFVKYTIRGKGTLKLKSRSLALTAGTLTGFKPGTAHHYSVDPAAPMEHFFFTFTGIKAAELFSKSMLNQRNIIETGNLEASYNLCQKILDTGLRKPRFSQDLCCHYLSILLLETNDFDAEGNAIASQSMRTYQMCKAYINNNFSHIQTPSAAAAYCNIDVRYMSSLFKKYAHITPSQYIMGLKLNKAANLLLTTNATIRDIAEQVGFSDPYHFSKTFKKFHGRSPNHYRIEHMK